MHRIACFAVFAALSFAQQPEAEPQKPPAGVDEALRARITEFYQYHVTEEYRKAEKLVAEESQDIYYAASKRHYLSFEIKTIAYSENFTRAKVNVVCEQYFPAPGFEGKPLKSPSISAWKLIDGKWFWYVDTEELARGPFGRRPDTGNKPTSPHPSAPPVPTTFDFVLHQVRFDKAFLVLKPGETQQVTITSSAPGTMRLNLYQVLPGIEVTVDKKELSTGEKALVTMKAGDNPHTGLIGFQIDPTGEVISIDIRRK